MNEMENEKYGKYHKNMLMKTVIIITEVVYIILFYIVIVAIITVTIRAIRIIDNYQQTKQIISSQNIDK